MQLAAETLTARRGDDIIFSEVSFCVAGGEGLILTGHNGSGKSTLLRIVAGFLRPEKGSVTFTDSEGRTDWQPSEVSHYLGHRNAMKNELTVTENLDFWRLFLSDRSQAPSISIEDAAEAVGLSDVTHLPFGCLSAGQQRRFAFAKLLVAHRPVWILDEPTAALDVDADRLFEKLIGEHQRNGGIVLAATHQPLGLSEVQELSMKQFAKSHAEAWGA